MGLDMMLYKAKKQKGIEDKDYLQTLGYDDFKDDEIAYWRKANEIHRWLFKNCARRGQHDYDKILVSKDKILELLLTAYRVKNSIELIDAEIEVGYTYENDEKKVITRQGKTIKDDTICKKLLPTQSGFFFGSLNYDEFYAQDIDLTIEQLENILQSVDFDNEFVFYWASY